MKTRYVIAIALYCAGIFWISSQPRPLGIEVPGEFGIDKLGHCGVYAGLAGLVADCAQRGEGPMWLDQACAPPIARGTVGLRIPVDRFTCKVKMSQDKDPVPVQNVIAQLRAPGPYNQPHLADDMERARNDRIGYPSAT